MVGKELTAGLTSVRVWLFSSKVYTPILIHIAKAEGNSHPLLHVQGTKGSTYPGCHIDIGAIDCQQNDWVK